MKNKDMFEECTDRLISALDMKLPEQYVAEMRGICHDWQMAAICTPDMSPIDDNNELSIMFFFRQMQKMGELYAHSKDIIEFQQWGCNVSKNVSDRNWRMRLCNAHLAHNPWAFASLLTPKNSSISPDNDLFLTQFIYRMVMTEYKKAFEWHCSSINTNAGTHVTKIMAGRQLYDLYRSRSGWSYTLSKIIIRLVNRYIPNLGVQCIPDALRPEYIALYTDNSHELYKTEQQMREGDLNGDYLLISHLSCLFERYLLVDSSGYLGNNVYDHSPERMVEVHDDYDRRYRAKVKKQLGIDRSFGDTNAWLLDAIVKDK